MGSFRTIPSLLGAPCRRSACPTAMASYQTLAPTSRMFRISLFLSLDMPSGSHSASGGRISGFTAGCVLVSNVIGGGIFTATGFMARDLGDPWLILLLWALGGLFALAG